MTEPVPIVEITNQAKLKRLGGPFAIPHALGPPQFAAVEAKIMVPLADFPHQPAGGVELRLAFL